MNPDPAKTSRAGPVIALFMKSTAVNTAKSIDHKSPRGKDRRLKNIAAIIESPGMLLLLRGIVDTTDKTTSII